MSANCSDQTMALLAPDPDLAEELALNRARYPAQDWSDLEDEVYETECVRCSGCGSTEFRYEESISAERSMVENRVGVEHDSEGLLVFNSYTENHGEGDGIPGVVCAGCDAVVDTSNIKVDWA